MGRSVGPWTEEAVVVIGIQVVRLHQPHQVHRIDRSRKSAVGLMDVIAHRLCAGDALFADRHRGVAMILTGNPVWHWGTIRSFACRLLSRQRPEHRVDGRVHALEIGRTIGLKDLIEADRVRQPRSWLRNDDREAERLEYFPRQDPAMHPAAEAYRLGRKKHVLSCRIRRIWAAKCPWRRNSAATVW